MDDPLDSFKNVVYRLEALYLLFFVQGDEKALNKMDLMNILVVFVLTFLSTIVEFFHAQYHWLWLY